MESVSLKTIKWENTHAIFQAVAENKRISRAEIAKQTGLSLMTVGKVADVLMHLRILDQAQETRAAAGRRAGLLSVSPNFYALILDVTEREIRAYTMDMRLEPMDSLGKITLSEHMGEGDFLLLIQQVQTLMERELPAGTCIGCGISVPNTYDVEKDTFCCESKPWLNAIHIRQTVQEQLSPPLLQMEHAATSAAIAHISQIPDYQKQIFLYLLAGEKTITGAILHRGKLLRGAHGNAGRFGLVQSAPWNTLESTFHRENSPETNAHNLAAALYNAIMLLDPDCIIIDCEIYSDPAPFSQLLQNILIDEFHMAEDALPRILFPAGTLHASRGLTIRLRDLWLHRLTVIDGKSHA